jgi:uncharacterized membrane protein
MNTATVPAVSGTRASWRLATFLGLVGLAAFVFVGAAALPYYLSPSFGPPEYAPRRGWLMLHISGGLVALLTGPVQLWLGLADRGMTWHRRMGTAYVAAVGTGAIAGYYMAFATDFGWLFGASLASLATAWVTTTGMAVLAIKRSLIEQHKEWMIRSYVLTFAFVLFRLVFPALQAAGIGTVPEQLAAAGWLSWTLPLLAAELILQGKKIVRVRA